MQEAVERRLPSIPHLVGSVVTVAILLGLGWGLVYEYAIKTLQENLPVHLQVYHSLSPTDPRWIRAFIADAFDVLIIAVAVVGTWWVLATIAREAREAGKWRLYYRSEEAKRDIWLPRLTAWQRIQHIWMMLTFIACAVTGFAANAHILAPRTTLLKIHVASGILMGILAVIHFIQYTGEAILAKLRGENLMERFPMLEIYTRKFLRNLVRGLLGKKMEDVGKYDPEQLFEYWGVYWGMAVLGIPGAIMLLAGPQALHGILWTMHTKEAVLATAFILMVHLAYTHARPTTFPMDPTYLIGKMPLRRALEEHPAWARKMLEKLRLRPGREAEPRPAEAPAAPRATGGGS